jgi:hypothetical protein
MMADEKTCGQCEHQTREFSKVDLKRLFKTMPEADVDDVMREVSDEQYRKDMSDMIDDCITHWKKQKDTNMDNLRDDILDLITN